MLNEYLQKITGFVRKKSYLLFFRHLTSALNVTLVYLLFFGFWLSIMDFPYIGRISVWLIFVLWLVFYLRKPFKDMLETVFPDVNKIQKWLINLSTIYPDISKLLSAFQLDQQYVNSQKEIFQKASEQKIKSFIFPEIRVDAPSVLNHLFLFLFLVVFTSILWVSNEAPFEKAMQKVLFIKSENRMTNTAKVVFAKKIFRSVEKDTLLISGDLHNHQKGDTFTILVSGSSLETNLELFPELSNNHFQIPLSLSKGIYSVKGKIVNSYVGKYLPDSSEIIIVEKPFIKYFSVKITPPSYTFLNSFTQVDRGNLSLLPGSRVYVNGTINKDITDADFVLNGTKIIALAKKKKQFLGHFYAKNISEWSMSIRDVDSLLINTNPSYSINYLLDTPPIIKINEPEGDVKLFNIDFIPFLAAMVQGFVLLFLVFFGA